MTRPHNGHSDATPFSHWLRALPHPLDSRTISNQNLDYVWHDYKRNFILTLEEKRFAGGSSPAQADTHGVIAQMLQHSDGNLVKTMRGIRPARYFGHFVVRFENTTPEDGKTWVNARRCSREGLIRLLSFDEEALDQLKAAA